MTIRGHKLKPEVRAERRDTSYAKRFVAGTRQPVGVLNQDEVWQGYMAAKRYQECDLDASPSWRKGWHMYWQSAPKTKRRMPLHVLREKRARA